MFREAVADGQGPRGRDVNFLLKLSAEFELQCADILGPKINLGTKKKADEEPERAPARLLPVGVLLQLGSGHAIGGRHLAAMLYLHTLLFYC